MERLIQLVPLTPFTRVLDVGGNDFNWRLVAVRPRLTFLNLSREFMGATDQADQLIVGDGCSLPFADQSFDLVFCNSVIEHVGGYESQERLAREITRVGKRYFVQTPNYWFPIEPHFIGLGVQFLPPTLRPLYARWLTPWGWIQRPTRRQSVALTKEIRLLTRSEMRMLFPNAVILSERLLGLTKSLIAISR